MFKSLFIILLALVAGRAIGQGTIDFANSRDTLVRNHLTADDAVAFSDGILIALYWAPLSDPNHFTRLGDAIAVGALIPGRFLGATTRTTGPATQPGSEAFFMVRAWEAAYGANYETALTAAPMNGRPALLAESPVLRMTTGGGGLPPSIPASILGTSLHPGFRGFVVQLVPEPSTLVLGLGALGGLALWRRVRPDQSHRRMLVGKRSSLAERKRSLLRQFHRDG